MEISTIIPLPPNSDDAIKEMMRRFQNTPFKGGPSRDAGQTALITSLQTGGKNTQREKEKENTG